MKKLILFFAVLLSVGCTEIVSPTTRNFTEKEQEFVDFVNIGDGLFDLVVPKSGSGYPDNIINGIYLKFQCFSECSNLMFRVYNHNRGIWEKRRIEVVGLVGGNIHYGTYNYNSDKYLIGTSIGIDNQHMFKGFCAINEGVLSIIECENECYPYEIKSIIEYSYYIDVNNEKKYLFLGECFFEVNQNR